MNGRSYTKAEVRDLVLYALCQGQLYPQLPEHDDVLTNVVEELSKLGLVDYGRAMKELKL